VGTDGVAEDGDRVARPDEDPLLRMHHDTSCLDQCRLQIVEVVVERAWALAGPIQETLNLREQVEDLCEDLFEAHNLPSARQVPSGVSLLGPSIPDPRLGLHAG
jgi:hypothetical protein